MTTADDTVPRVDTDVVVVGAGPAGLACAAALLRGTGLRVTVVDAGHGLGGQYWRQPARGSADARLHHDLAAFVRLRDTVVDGATLLLQHEAWAVVPEGTGDSTTYAVHALDRSGGPGAECGRTLRTRTLVVATGAYDRALPFPGWDLPGVMTVGGLQALLKGSGVTPGTRVVLGGTGPFLLPVAATLARLGTTVVGVHEANAPTRWLRHAGPVARNPAKLREGAEYAAAFARHGVPYRTRSMIVAAHGDDRVESVTVARLDRSGRLRPGTARTLAADAVGIGWGFTPQLDLPLTLGCATTMDASGTTVVAVDDRQRTSRLGVYAAGEPCGVAGAATALVEGELAAVAVARDLAGVPLGSDARLLRLRRRLRGFAAAMHRAHPVPSAWAEALQPSTVLCRCEEVSCGAVGDAVATGADSARQVKQLTRAGMGWCQGRVCGYAASLLSGEGPATTTERLVATPVPLGTLTPPHNGM